MLEALNILQLHNRATYCILPICQLWMSKGRNNKPQLTLPLHLLSICQFILYSVSISLRLPYYPAHTPLLLSHTPMHTQFLCHTVARLSLLQCFFFSSIHLCLCVSDLCSCDPCSTPLFYDSGPQCHSNLGQHHKEQTLEILWRM